MPLFKFAFYFASAQTLFSLKAQREFGRRLGGRGHCPCDPVFECRMRKTEKL